MEAPTRPAPSATIFAASPTVPVAAGGSPAPPVGKAEHRRVETDVPHALRSERNRTIASLRGRLRFLPDEASRRAIARALDEMEQEAHL